MFVYSRCVYFCFVLAQVWKWERGKRPEMVDTGGWWEKKNPVEIIEPSGVGCGPGCRLASFSVSQSALFEQEFSRKLDGTWARVQFIYFFFFSAEIASTC